jgi:hypothetical protein
MEKKAKVKLTKIEDWCWMGVQRWCVVPDGAIKDRRGRKEWETLSEEKGERNSSDRGGQL